jgi:environmental stress-induced protein Ves
LIQTDALPAVPWKNGGGTTRNLAIAPDDAGLDDFRWRVSIADVRQSGKFSLFPGVDRTIVLLEGNGMVLHADDGTQFALTAQFVGHTFRGETGMEARLVGGPTRDFNVMVRRGFAHATVECWRAETRMSRDVDEAVFFCPTGVFRLSTNADADYPLSAGCALRVSGVSAGTRLIPESEGAVLIGALIDLIEA